MDATIRPATPDDADFVAWVILESSRSHLPEGVWDQTLGGDEPERLDILAELSVAAERSFLHHERFLIADVDGRPAAGLSGYDPGDATDDLLLAALRGVLGRRGWDDDRFAAALPVLFTYALVTPELSPGLFVVEWVACRAEHRGQGLVGRLLENVLGRGRADGYGEAEISILIGNDPAERAYVKAGFTTASEKRHPDFEELSGSPGIASMTMAL